MKLKRSITALLACMLLVSWSFIPAAAAEVPSNNIVMPRVSGRLNHSFPANLITLITEPFTLTTGDTIKYDCTYTPKSASMDFGYFAPNGLFYSLNSTSGSINKSNETITLSGN